MNLFLARMSRIQICLILFIFGFFVIQLDAQTNKNFETPPPAPGSIQWQDLQTRAQQTQELYRPRIAVPNAVTGDVRVADDALFAKPSEPSNVAQSPATSSGRFVKCFFFSVVFIFGAGMALRIFFPEFFERVKRRLAPEDRDLEFEIPSNVPQGEKETVTQFFEKFRVGPVTPAADAPGKSAWLSQFYDKAAGRFDAQRKLLHNLAQETDDYLRRKQVMDLRSEIGALKNEADCSELRPAWQVALVLDGLLKQLTEKISNLTPASLRAIADSLDLLHDLCTPEIKPDILTNPPLKFLIVDDDMIGRHALSVALSKAFGRPDVATNGDEAITHADKNNYDVIFLDVQMPGMDGFEVCTRIRKTLLNRQTPVVFVTALADFNARAQSTLIGGTDLMAKPFLLFEVALKAVTLSLRHRLRKPVSEAKMIPFVAVNPPKIPAKKFTISADVRRPLPVTAEVDEMTAAFLNRVSKEMDSLKNLFGRIVQAPGTESSQNLLAESFLRVNSWVPHDGIKLAHPVYSVCVALEVLLKKFLENPKYSTAESLATAAAAVDLLRDLCHSKIRADLIINPLVRILVVDDDLVSRRIVVGALQVFFEKPESAENGELALAMVTKEKFDVIFLDIEMPRVNGFEVCSGIRSTLPNAGTPVIFMTSVNDDFGARIQMSRNLEADLMVKPFLTAEITLKALTQTLRGRLKSPQMGSGITN